MQKKRAKKSWQRHNRFYCCAYCSGDIGREKRFRIRNRCRRKFSKYPQKTILPDE